MVSNILFVDPMSLAQGVTEALKFVKEKVKQHFICRLLSAPVM